MPRVCSSAALSTTPATTPRRRGGAAAAALRAACLHQGRVDGHSAAVADGPDQHAPHVPRFGHDDAHPDPRHPVIRHLCARHHQHLHPARGRLLQPADRRAYPNPHRGDHGLTLHHRRHPGHRQRRGCPAAAAVLRGRARRAHHPAQATLGLVDSTARIPFGMGARSGAAPWAAAACRPRWTTSGARRLGDSGHPRARRPVQPNRVPCDPAGQLRRAHHSSALGA